MRDRLFSTVRVTLLPAVPGWVRNSDQTESKNEQLLPLFLTRPQCPLWVISGHMAARSRDVRFTPESGHSERRTQCPFSAISDIA